MKINEAAFGEVQLWPNPTSSELNISYEIFEAQEVKMFVTNVLGSVIWTGETDAVKGLNRTTINVSNWSSGSYLVHFNARDQALTRLVIVSN